MESIPHLGRHSFLITSRVAASALLVLLAAACGSDPDDGLYHRPPSADAGEAGTGAAGGTGGTASGTGGSFGGRIITPVDGGVGGTTPPAPTGGSGGTTPIEPPTGGSGGGGGGGTGNSGGGDTGGSGGSGTGGNGTGGSGGGGTTGSGGGGTGGGSVIENPRGKFAPPAGQTMLVIGQDTDSIEEYVRDVGPMPAGVMLYTNIADLAGIEWRLDFGAGEQYLPHWTAKSEPFVLQFGLELVDSLGDINSGALDGNIRTLAARLAATRRPVFLRVGYEFDADWTNYHPDQFRPAFRHVVDLFDSQDVENVAFVWHAWAYYSSFGQSSVDPWYPGDEYVDWVGVSVFPGWNDQSGRDAVQKIATLGQFARNHDKPFMIAEAAPREVYEPSRGQYSWDRWYAPAFQYIEDQDAAMFSYINANWDAQPFWSGQGWGDSRVQTNSTVLSNWRQQVSGSRFLHSSSQLYQQIGFQAQ